MNWRVVRADKTVNSLQENQSLLLTPFERNLEVWRQLWRTCERSDLIVQIVDARNPLSFRSEDLAKYVLELNREIIGEGELGEGTSRPTKRNLLLINKSDLLTQNQRFVFSLFSVYCYILLTSPPRREGWADYFEAQQIQYAFFSAANSTALQEERARLEAIPDEEDLFTSDEEDVEEEEEEELDEEEMEGARMKIPKSGSKLKQQIRVEEGEEDSGDDTDEELANKMSRGAGISMPGSDESERTRILSVLELEDLFLGQAPAGSFPRRLAVDEVLIALRRQSLSLSDTRRRRWLSDS